MAPLRWAIVGAGKISHDFVTAIQIFPDNHSVVAVGSGNRANAEKFAEEHKIPKAYEGYEGIAKDKEVDVVYIGNLNTQHYASTKLMLEHGKPVLCEKPFTMNEKQTTDLIELARAKKVFLMEAVWSRCFPVYKKVRELIDEGAIGEVMFANVNFGFNLQNKERITNKNFGGGAILDLGIYILQFQQFVFRGLKPIKVVVAGSLTKDGVDGTSAALISYENGKLASVTCSAEIFLPNEGIIIGTKGMMRLPRFWCPSELITSNKTYNFDIPQSEVKFKYLYSGGLLYEADEVKQCLEEGKLESPQITHCESIQLAQLMDLMRKEVGLRFKEDD
ncbi:hypothetical protein WA026_013092 [Henosepilachna vigintioctopunctata]|uniref:Trans-1,2-dihydrobenzene-1,2-diol dehydrogenase n=1 Tax=Henosepilachna vigintioctopunctata TaxID=420089 RepID=A0AAW1ULW5_9CUCU